MYLNVLLNYPLFLEKIQVKFGLCDFFLGFANIVHATDLVHGIGIMDEFKNCISSILCSALFRSKIFHILDYISKLPEDSPDLEESKSKLAEKGVIQVSITRKLKLFTTKYANFGAKRHHL